ncbi:MAG: TldD/PmbA family protein [Rubellimicrobium sp.]|nr:TldD/PmbA family protein [Rubellimicrobium sp.]
MTDLSALADALLAAARAAGADAADAMAVSDLSLSVEVRGGALEHAERAEGVEIGLRVFVGQRGAVVSSSDTSAATVAGMAERAVAMAREAPEDPWAGLADPGQLARDLDAARLELADPAPEPEPDSLMALAQMAEAAALSVAGVTQAEGAAAGHGRRQVHRAASNGFSAGLVRTDSAISCGAIAGTGTGMERDHDHDARIFAADLEAADRIGRNAGTRAVARLGGRKPPTGRFPVLFDERISGSITGHLLSAINGAAIARGSSFLRDRLGRPVLPAHLSLLTEPHRRRATGSRLHDAEGLPTAPRALVADGVLQGWLLDLASARKLGLTPTGDAARGPGDQPSPSAGNIRLQGGSGTRADLLRDMGTGLLVTRLIGATINPNTGDYSRGASGFWVENGEIAWPVNECTIAGNLVGMFAGLVAADDARQHLSHVVPSLLIDGLMIAGA